jgi:hypothetical protein
MGVMAKSKGLFQKAAGDIKSFEKAARKDRVRDFRLMSSANEGIAKNLSLTTKGVSRRLGRDNARTLARMQTLQMRLKAAGRKDAGAYQRSLVDYGGMLTGRNAKSVGYIAQQGKAGVTMAKAGVQAGKSSTKTGSLLTDAAKQTTKELKAASEYELAKGLHERAQTDAETAAQMRFELTQMKLQHQLALREMEKQAEIARDQARWEQNLAARQLGEQSFSMIQPAVRALTSAYPDIRDWANEGMTIQEILNKLVEEGTLTSTDITMPQVRQVVYNVTHDTQKGTDDVAKDIAQAIRTTPGWGDVGNGKKDRLMSWIRAEINQVETSSAKTVLEKNEPQSTSPSNYDIATGRPDSQEKAAAEGYEDAFEKMVQEYMAAGYSREAAEHMVELNMPDYSGAQL